MNIRTFLFLLLSFFLLSLSFAQSNQASWYLEQTEIFWSQKEYEKALNTLNTGIEKMPDSVKLYDARGVLLEAFQMYEEAIEDFSMAIHKTNDPKMKSHLLANRGGVKSHIRDFEGSYADLVMAIKLDSTNIDALNNLAAVCDEVNKPEETLLYLNQIIQVDSTYVPAYVNLGFKYQKMEEHEKAIRFFNKAIKMAPNEPLGYSNRSFSKLKTHDLAGAMEDVNRSLELYPTNSYAYKIRALIYIELDALEEACADVKLAEELGYTQQFGEEINELQAKYCQ